MSPSSEVLVAQSKPVHGQVSEVAGVRRIRTDDWPERDRLEMFRDRFGRDRVRVEPRPNESLRIVATLVKLRGLQLVWGHRSPLRSEFSDGNDRLLFNLGSDAIAMQFGREIVLRRGDAVVLSGAERGSFTTFQSGRIATVEMANGALLPLLGDPAARCGRRIPGGTPALRLLYGYLRSFLADAGVAMSSLQQLAVAHVCDLAAVAVGATREAGEIANGHGGGVRAARLRAIKDDVSSRLEREVRLDDVAARHGVSARYVRMLFAGEGASFTEFVRDQRLERAHRTLCSPRFVHLSIATIAFDVGFNDVSYFNRSFRRRFGQSPREVRESARVQPDDC